MCSLLHQLSSRTKRQSSNMTKRKVRHIRIRIRRRLWHPSIHRMKHHTLNRLSRIQPIAFKQRRHRTLKMTRTERTIFNRRRIIQRSIHRNVPDGFRRYMSLCRLGHRPWLHALQLETYIALYTNCGRNRRL